MTIKRYGIDIDQFDLSRSLNEQYEGPLVLYKDHVSKLATLQRDLAAARDGALAEAAAVADSLCCQLHSIRRDCSSEARTILSNQARTAYQIAAEIRALTSHPQPASGEEAL